eukprot:3158906-Rhodomonas_salina.1
MEMMLGSAEGSNPRLADSKEGGLQVAAAGMARSMKKEKQKAKHEKLLREEEAKRKEDSVPEGPAVKERERHGPLLLLTLSRIFAPLPRL